MASGTMNTSNNRTEASSQYRLLPVLCPGLFNIFRPSCRTWPDCLLTTISVFLGIGITMLIVGFLVPRTPPFTAKEELTAREYEALAAEYAHRGFIVDVVMVAGLACLLVGAIALSALHIVVYCNGYGSCPALPAHFQRRTSCDGGNSSPSETMALSERAASYGVLEETQH